MMRGPGGICKEIPERTFPNFPINADLAIRDLHRLPRE
jgi:hypothetical protein